MNDRFIAHLRRQIQELKDGGLYKEERVIDSQQSADIRVAGGVAVINFCANNYHVLANHLRLIRASIIEGVRLSKAQRYRYGNNDMADLEAQLKTAASARFKLIATDGVFSMD